MRKNDLIIFGFLIILIVAAYRIDRSPFFTKLRTAMQIQTVPDGLLNYGTMGKIFKQLGLVKAIPNDSSQFPRTNRQNKEINSGQGTIQINIETNKKTIFQVYWSEEGLPYVKNKSAAIKIRPSKSRYTIFLADLVKIRRLRIDPAKTSVKMRIHSIAIESGVYQSIILNSTDAFKQLKSLKGIRNIVYSSTGMTFNTHGMDSQFELRINPKRNIETTVFQRKRLVGEYIYKANPKGFSGLPSSIVIKPIHFKKGWPILSIVARESDLYHPDKGIIINKTSRGRAWERPAYISYFENGELRYASMAGIRMHGGKRLQLYNNFRLYFRKAYGASEFKPGILFSPQTEPLKRLVVHYTAWPPGWPFNNPLAYDIAHQIGAIVPEIKLVELFLNGVSKGIYFLTPHLSRRQFEPYFGHSNFDLYLFKKRNTANAEAFYIKKFWEYTNSREPLKMDEVGKVIDLDNLTKHVFSFVFSGTTDFCQGAAALDNNKKDGKLFWVHWDMDHSFIDVGQTFHGKHKKRKIWEQSAWPLVYRKKNRSCGRQRLFTRLMDEDQAYKEFVIALAMDLLNHRINARFLNARLQFYDNLLSSYGKKNSLYIKKLDQFFQNRPSFLRTEMQKIFGIGEIVRFEVKGPPEMTYEIDGFAEPAGYIGYYRKESTIKIAIKNRQKDIFSHWIVNGKRVYKQKLIHTIRSKTVIAPVFTKS